MLEKIDKYFGITAKKSSFNIEIMGGVTAYFAMAYVIFVNPIILAQAGMPQSAVFAATIISSAIAMLIMGIYSKFPLGIAPCMSMNAFFAYSVVLGMGLSWQTALAAVLVASLIFSLISLMGLRAQIISAIPHAVKQAGTVGLGIFIAFVGMKNSGIIVPSSSLFITFGGFSNPNVIIAVVGILTAGIFLVRKSQYAVFFGMVCAALTGLIIRYGATAGLFTIGSEYFNTLPQLPAGLPFTLPVEPIMSMVDNTLFTSVVALPNLLNLPAILVVCTFLFLDFFGTATTLSAATSQIPEFKDGGLEDSSKVFFADALGSTVGSLLGTSSLSTYIESVSGVIIGARTGLMVVVTAILFLLSLFFYPLLTLVTSAVTTPALFIIGVFMMKNVITIDWHTSFEEIIPAFITIVMMPLTGSIALGLTMGFVSYEVLMLVARRHKELPLTMHIIAAISILYMITL
ncbi:MAG: NCS2 family permease [Culicoidibacterales bacterium]